MGVTEIAEVDSGSRDTVPKVALFTRTHRRLADARKPKDDYFVVLAASVR
jgi:hypothetical protein